jgi:hypothetical protein
MDVDAALARWHSVVEHRAAAAIPSLLADDVVFRSPAVHTPQRGRPVVTAYLTAALRVLGPELEYHREWRRSDSVVLEFTTEVAGMAVHGVDMITWGEDGRITDFTVMVRPAKGLEALVERMGAELEQMRERGGP